MNRTPYLIQRLLKPYKVENANPLFKDNPFSFGGGLVNGGISKQAMDLLREIWNYDYMGSAEFEWGAVPESLQKIAKNIANYTIGEIVVKAKYVDWENARKDVYKQAPVYFVCEKADVEEVKTIIQKFAGEKERDFNTKEHVGLAENICGEKYSEKKVGWHDIDNHYLFFTDKTMFDKFCELFGIK